MRKAVSAAVALVALLSGCVMNASPGVRACVSQSAITAGPTSGTLRIVPSRIAGVEIDTATWKSTAGMRDFSAHQTLEFRLSLRSAHDSLDRAIVALFQLHKRNGDVVLHPDEHLYVADRGGAIVFVGEDEHSSEKRFPTTTWRELESGMATGFFSASDACPVAVGIVPKSDLALYQQRGAKLTDTRETLLSRIAKPAVGADTGVFQILSTASSTSDLGDTYGVVVRNRTDTIVNAQVVALVVPSGGPTRGSTTGDTIEYLVPSLKPGAVITLTGGNDYGGESRAVTYPVSRVVGRNVADDMHNYRVSAMPRMRVQLSPESTSQVTGVPVPLRLAVVDSATNNWKTFEAEPVIWRVRSDNETRLTDTTRRQALVRARRAGIAYVTATVGGMVVRSTITFAARPDSILPPIHKRDPGDTLGYQIPCTIHPDGRIELREWITPEVVTRIRADTVTRSERSNRARAGLIAELAKCKL